MKKVLFMVSSMDIGGVEKSLLSLLSAMHKSKYDITVLLLEKKGGFLGYIPDWVKIEQATWFEELKPIILQPPQKTIKKYFAKKSYIKGIQFLTAYLLSKYLDNRYIYYNFVFGDISNNANEYDVAIAYQGPTDIIDFYIANKVNAKKKFSWVHFDISKFLINRKLYCELYSKYNMIFTVSKGARASLLTLLPEIKSKVIIFRNIISYKLIKSLSEEHAEFEDYSGIKLVTVGRLSKEKGQDLAINVLRRLRDNGYDAKWYCVGDGKCKKEYEVLIKQNNLENDFILLGASPNPYPYMLKADIYIQPSRHEGYCLTLAEAKCLKIPIITSNFVGAYEQIKNYYNGIITGCSEESLYEKIKYLIDNPLVRQKLTENLEKEHLDSSNKIDKLFYYMD